MALKIPFSAVTDEMDAGATPLSPAELVAEFARYMDEPSKGSHTRLVLGRDGRIRIHILVIKPDNTEEIVRDVLLPVEIKTLGAVLSHIVSLE